MVEGERRQRSIQFIKAADKIQTRRNDNRNRHQQNHALKRIGDDNSPKTAKQRVNQNDDPDHQDHHRDVNAKHGGQQLAGGCQLNTG